MYLFIILLPLLSAFWCGFFGNLIGKEGVIKISISFIGGSFILSLFAFFEVILSKSPCYIDLTYWIDSNFFNISWSFMFDTLTVIMLFVVNVISLCVHIYSVEYMNGDPHFQRFISYLSLFTFFMIILVTGDNFLQMFLGWEGVGLCSYLLINFWYGRIQANKAALKAMIINRVGDFGLALGIFALLFVFKSLDYTTVFALVPKLQNNLLFFFGYKFNIIDFICFFLFIGCIGKSAQIGLHSWLPDAMEGPTPVSALIHAATMVTAGIFLISRCSFLFQYSTSVSFIVTLLGAITAFIAGTIGLLQNDLKRVIAYSTCSQLGYMVFACGLSSYTIGMFHLSNHAFFKALLFLSAGSVIHGLADEQDMRRMGGLIRLMPFTYTVILIGSLSLMGFPFLTGFYSKDAILEISYSSYTFISTFAYWLGILAAFLTAFYSTRLIYITFLKKPLGSKQYYLYVHESKSNFLTIPLFILALFSIFIGYLMKDMMIGFGTTFWGNSLFILPYKDAFFEVEWIPISIKILPLIFSLGGSLVAFLLYNYNSSGLINFKLNSLGRCFYNFFNRKWYFDRLYNQIFSQTLLHYGYKNTYKDLDRGLVEILGPFGIAFFLYNQSNIFITNSYKIFVSFLYQYLNIFFIFIILIIFLVLYNDSFYMFFINNVIIIFFYFLYSFFVNKN